MEDAVGLFKLLALGPVVKGARHVHFLCRVRPVGIPRNVSNPGALGRRIRTGSGKRQKAKDMCESWDGDGAASPVRQRKRWAHSDISVGCWLWAEAVRRADNGPGLEPLNACPSVRNVSCLPSLARGRSIVLALARPATNRYPIVCVTRVEKKRCD